MTEHQFEFLFKEHFAYLSNVAYGVVKDEDDSYDIVQKVFAKFWDKRFDVDLTDNIKSYLHRATLNTSLNFLDKNKRMVKIEDARLEDISSHSVEDNTDYLSGEVENAVKKAISELPEKCKIVFSLSRYSDKTNREIAEELEISIKAVEKHISRALRELRVKLKPYLNSIIIILMFGVGQLMF
ncbi:MAG: RNA polymerase sigma-70 factor [Salinivirgaceae bacterium]|jgi:RNA polymerase sigma-70 factor (ECF subfamily)|nr:RNA polymerase sigma-70 factor [Salinivirgaceae bacterium]